MTFHLVAPFWSLIWRPDATKANTLIAIQGTPFGEARASDLKTVGIGGRLFTVPSSRPSHQSNLRKLRKGVRPASEGAPFAQHSFAMITNFRLRDASVRF